MGPCVNQAKLREKTTQTTYSHKTYSQHKMQRTKNETKKKKNINQKIPKKEKREVTDSERTQKFVYVCSVEYIK